MMFAPIFDLPVFYRCGRHCRRSLESPQIRRRLISLGRESFLLSARGRQNIGPAPGVCCRARRKPYHASIARCTREAAAAPEGSARPPRPTIPATQPISRPVSGP